MPVWHRRRRRWPGSLALLALTVCLPTAFPHSAYAASRSRATRPPTAASSAHIRILVNSYEAGKKRTPGQVTLQDALTEASRSPLPTTIEFDAASMGKSATIRLIEPIVLQSLPAPLRIEAMRSKIAITIDASACADAGIIVGGDTQLTLAGVTIRGGKQRVILCKDQARLLLEGVTVCDGTLPGIAAFGQTHVVLTDSRLLNNRTHGLEAHGQCTARLDRVDLSHNGQAGIAGFDGAHIIANRCRLEQNGEWGIVLTDTSRSELTTCTMKKSRFANADVSGSASLTATDCELLDGQRFGLFATGRTSIRLNSTRVAGSGSRGVEAQDRTTIDLTGCRIETSADYGLILFGQTRANASDCFFSHNSAHGVSLRGTASGQFTRCAFVGNRFSGLGCLDGHDGGSVIVSQCVFRQNGMRPIYRGPLHIDPIVPTPLRVRATKVQCLADPRTTVELYLDRAGEASRYIGALATDDRGRFDVDTHQVPDGWVMTAAATVNGATSEFNVIAASPSAPVLDALLGRTGPLSDDGGEINLDMMTRRWPPRSRLVFQIEKAPSVAVERYVRFLIQQIPEWTGGCIKPEIVMGTEPSSRGDAVVIPIHYVDPDAQQLASRGGVTYMRWDANGFFLQPMEIMLALGRDPQETCPRVLAHEIGHALGLCHARVGLLSRMQGSAPPGSGYVNDFSPMMTYFDVVALQALHDTHNTGGVSLRQLVQRGAIPAASGEQIAQAKSAMLEPTFSPRPADLPASGHPSRNTRP